MLLTLAQTPRLDDDVLSALDAESSRARERGLRADLQRMRQERPGSGLCADAYNRLARECALMGRPLGALREHSVDEEERFFARTVPGPDGHIYWTGAAGGFYTARHTRTLPRRWWFARRYDVVLDHYDILESTCGDAACINPEHAARSRRSRQIYSDQSLLGAIQVQAARLGHPPSTKDWKRSGRTPSDAVIIARFGSWEKALHAAGFTGYTSIRQATRADCLSGIRLVHDLTGKWPTREAYEHHGDILQAHGFPRSGTTVMQFFGRRWPPAVEAARNA